MTASPARRGEWGDVVALASTFVEEVHDLDAVQLGPVGDQAAVAAIGRRLGAHDRGRGLGGRGGELVDPARKAGPFM